MGHSNGIITPPVNTADVSYVTRRGSNDVGTLCGNNPMINKWAKYKPVIYHNLIDTTGQLNSDKTWKSSATWWKASDSKCGFIINLRTDSAALVNNWGTDWTYNPPTGGMNAPYRLIDFNYYDHNAVNPVYVTYPSEFVKNQGNPLNVLFNAFYGNPNRLLLPDFLNGIWNSQTENMYCGVLLTIGVRDSGYSDQMTKISVVNPTPLGSGNTDSEKYIRTVSVPYDKLSDVNEGAEIKIYPFLCQTAYAIQKKPDVNGNHATWESGVVACPSEMTKIYVVNSWISGALTVSSGGCKYYNPNAIQIAFNYVITSHYGFSRNELTAYLYVLDVDADTSGKYPDNEKKYNYHIIEAAGRNPFMGQYFGAITLSDGATMSFDQSTLMLNTTDYFLAGIDAASYIEDYRRRYGSSVKARVNLLIEFHDGSNGTYGTTPIVNVEISGTY